MEEEKPQSSNLSLLPSSSSSAPMEFSEGSSSSKQPLLQPSPFIEKEHMFDKVVTPSDVGKLNRLVIPKQHAEKFFPLEASQDKGMLLNFEDRTGKPWRFRYSYWNSSQSYVMTKGWSRFVKEKRLDAGDTVSFGRGITAKDRLFIDWKRRVDSVLRFPIPAYPHDQTSLFSFSRPVIPWNSLSLPQPSGLRIFDYGRQLGYGNNPFMFLRSAGPSSQGGVQLNSDRRPDNSSKRVRLFGVNLDSTITDKGKEEEEEESQTRMRLGPSPEMEESPRKGKQPLSLDLEM